MQSLRPFLSTPSDAIIAADRDGVIRFWNPGAARLFGYSHDEAISYSLDLIILSGCVSGMGIPISFDEGQRSWFE